MQQPALFRVSLLVLMSFLGFGQLAFGQTPVNSWTNPVSGSWEDMHWSLGVLPASGQSIMITNAGWKAVSISFATVQGFPQTLSPYSVTVSSPTNSRNTLLLNYAGYDFPLSVFSLQINGNSEMTALASRVAVADVLSVGGNLNQGASALISARQLQLGNVGPGTYNFTNGTLLVNELAVIGGSFPGGFTQFGGTNFTGSVQFFQGGLYELYGGDLTTSNIIYRSGNSFSGNFKQHGGTVNAGQISVTRGSYSLDGGTLATTYSVELPGVVSPFDYADSANFVQSAGTNRSSLDIGTYRPPFANASAFGNYTLSNGVLSSAGVTIGPYGTFNQYGGAHTNAGLDLHGDTVYFGAPGFARYALSGGTLSSLGAELTIASFNQTGGTNETLHNLFLNVSGFFGASYQLTDGWLQTSNTIVIGSPYNGGGFGQNGGIHRVSNLLSLSRPSLGYSGPSPARSGYVINGGELFAPRILVDSGATFQHLGGAVSNSGTLTLANGDWIENTTGQQFGTLLLATSQSFKSSLTLPSGPCSIRFADSSSIAWSNQAVLVIENWNGSITGNGLHHIYFGSASTGLLSQQLGQIQFDGPNGSAGTYPATILSTGEIVPAQFLSSQSTEAGLQLIYPPGTVLQSSPNVLGPYQDVSEASNGYMIYAGTPQRFFRLRRTQPSNGFVYELAR